MNYPTLKPIRNLVRILPSASIHKGLIELPAQYQNAIATGMVMDVGRYANAFLEKHQTVMVDALAMGKRLKITHDNEFLVPDSDILGIMLRGQLYPLGRTILFERDMKDLMSEGGIVTPETRRNQSRFGWVRCFGLDARRRRIKGININSYCCLTGWEEHMRELAMGGKKYIIVKETDLLYEQCN